MTRGLSPLPRTDSLRVPADQHDVERHEEERDRQDRHDPRLASALYYRDPGKAIDWLVKAFGFTVYWINRSGAPVDRLGFTPDRVIGSLKDLA